MERSKRWYWRALIVSSLFIFSQLTYAVTVKTVPWVATNPLIPHDTWSGKTITLKGTSDIQGVGITYAWDFGDGSPPATGAVGNQYVIEATHTYTGSTGDIFTARLTVTDTNIAESASKTYFVQIQDQSLPIEVNVAIDEGLWYLHKTMYRTGNQGYWTTSGLAGSSYVANQGANLNAFFVNGHLETSDANNPYTDSVQRGMRYLFTRLNTIAIGSKTYPAPIGTVNPDSNGNGLGVQVNNTYPPYQGGSVMDAIVASGTPAALTTTGPAGIVGRSYADIAQDMVDMYASGQGYIGTFYGGWRYGWNYTNQSDNSTNQWAAIGMIAAEREFGSTVPQFVKDANINSVNRTQHPTIGQFGYTNSTTPVWGPYAVTPSGMVQMVMDGIGRGDARWDLAETFMRDRFCNTGGAGNAVRDYYYGMFSFTKSMLLHDANGDGIAEPITLVQSATPGNDPLDWYEAEASKGDACDGVARTLVNDQNAAGYWYAHNFSSAQYRFETGWAIIMLNRSVFSSGLPVAVASAVPNPAVVGQNITLDGSDSFHQDADKNIVSWAWDLDNDGVFDNGTGPSASTSYAALGTYTVGLQACDDATPAECDETTVAILVTVPPIAPTADADGPYVFCPGVNWFLDGTGSVNPDEGAHLGEAPGDTIQEYAWELNGDNSFNDALGAQPDVTAYFNALGVGDYLIQLRVTDTTSTSFPLLVDPFPDLSDTDSAQVSVKAAGDPACDCISNLTARAKTGKVQLVWTDTGADHYNVYRSTTAGGPYTKIAETTSRYSTYLDQGLVNGTTYHYVVRPAKINGNEACQSNEASATPVATTPRRRR